MSGKQAQQFFVPFVKATGLILFRKVKVSQYPPVGDDGVGPGLRPTAVGSDFIGGWFGGKPTDLGSLAISSSLKLAPS